MKKYLSFVVLFILSASVYSQKIRVTGIPIDDAQVLIKLQKQPLANSEILKILSYYTTKNLPVWDSALAVFEKNKFINEYLKDCIKPSDGLKFRKDVAFSAISSIGGIDVTNFADGMAKFLVKRMKQELNIAFFEKFKNDLCKDEFADLKILFPETWKTLGTIDKNIYQYSNYLNTLRQVFIKDMTNQYINLQYLLHQEKYVEYFNNEQPELGSILYSSLYFINGLSSGLHPGDVLNNFTPSAYLNFCSQRPGKVCDSVKSQLQINVRNSVATIQLLSNSLRSTSSANYWVPADSLRMFVENRSAFKIYLGLVYEKAESISFITGDSPKSQKKLRLQQILNEVYDNSEEINKYLNFVETFSGKIQEINEYVSVIRDKKKSEIDYNDYYRLYASSIDLLGQTVSFVDLPYVELGQNAEKKIKAATASITYITRTTGDLYVDVRTKNYSSAIVDVVGILDTLLKKNEKFDQKGETLKLIFKYGTFISNVAQAENSDDVCTAIESFALPSGSASIKKNSAFNISLNAYLGGFGGNEFLADNSKKNWAGTYGITAPVGLAFSFGLGKASSATGFISVIDVGAFASYRLRDTSSAKLPQVTLQNIFAPGLGVIIGLPKLPVSVGYLYQIGPAVRKITNEEIYLKSGKLNQRWFFFVAVDIPIVNFYNKPRN